MPRYTVTVRYEKNKDITVHARDTQEAEEKAVAIVEAWRGVICADAQDVEEAE